MDDHTGGDLSNVRISVDELSAETGPGGFAIFYLTTGIYQISLMRFNYHPAEMELSVTSDTTLDIHLLASHGKLIFKLKDGMQFVKNALVKVGSDSLLSNNYGVCIFESVLIGTPLSYSIKHDHYYEMGGDLDLQSDTTIDLQLEKSVANIKFTVETISGPVENGYVILYQDTAWCNAQGMANFFYKPKGQQYQYQVNGDFYEAQTGMINLVTDTSIIVTLSRTIETGQIKALEPSIYPNPAKDHLLVDMKENRAEFVRMADLTGKTVLVQNYPVPQSALALHLNFEPGIYLIYIRTETSEYRTKILIR
jgi:hypothetical protein